MANPLVPGETTERLEVADVTEAVRTVLAAGLAVRGGGRTVLPREDGYYVIAGRVRTGFTDPFAAAAYFTGRG